MHLRDHAALDQIDGEREHHADSERDQNGLRVIAGPVQIRDAVPERGGQTAAPQRSQARAA